MCALREGQALNGAERLDWWPGAGGATWEIEWQSGPYAYEAIEALLHIDDDEDPAAHALRGLVREGSDPDRHYAHLVVFDVPVTLRALTPIGARGVLRCLAGRPGAEVST